MFESMLTVTLTLEDKALLTVGVGLVSLVVTVAYGRVVGSKMKTYLECRFAEVVEGIGTVAGAVRGDMDKVVSELDERMMTIQAEHKETRDQVSLALSQRSKTDQAWQEAVREVMQMHSEEQAGLRKVLEQAIRKD